MKLLNKKISTNGLNNLKRNSMESLQKQFVPYELSLKMKQLGYDEPCITFYPVNLTQPLIGDYATLGLNGKYSSIKDGYRNSVCLNQLWKKRYKQDYANVAAPTYSQAFRWFREEYGLYSWIQLHNGYINDSFYPELPITFSIMDRKLGNKYYERDIPHNYLYKTYEEAELACLEKLIEIVEEKQKEDGR